MCRILTIHKIGEQRGIHFMAMDFVEGETLRQRLTRDELDLPTALDIALQVTAPSDSHSATDLSLITKPRLLMGTASPCSPWFNAPRS